MMPPNGKKQHLPPSHVLSNLPQNAIDEILTRLPLRDAVRTSILSKEWRYIWCRLPQLKFDHTIWEMFPTIRLADIVNHLLLFYTGPITKFTLNFSFPYYYPNVDNLIYFLSRNDVQNVVLKVSIGNPYKLPAVFFTNFSFKHLSLESCFIHPPPDFKGYDRLISLELRFVKISSKCLGSLISHCPLLENLVLVCSDNSNSVEINAPKLRSFVFCGNIHLIHLENVPLLSNVTYKPTEHTFMEKRDLANIFKTLPALENLCWDHFIIQDMITICRTTRFPSAPNCLKRLVLSNFHLGRGFEFWCARCLIIGSPYLEELEIKVTPFVNYALPRELMPHDVVDDIPAFFSGLTFNHLRTVKINGVSGTEAEMQVMKVLLAKSPALVRMVLKPAIAEYRKSLKVLATITKFQRASSGAEVVYNVD